MIVPSIDIQDGQAVQLVGGRDKAIDGGDPLEVAERFAVAGELAVIDLDAAMGKGDNSAIIEQIVRRYPTRVGGGIRSREVALRWLDAGAEKIILGTAAQPELLSQLPRTRVIAALDAAHGEVLVEGWVKKTGQRVEERIRALREHVGGFLLTFVELEGRLEGTDLERARELVQLAGDARVTIAGGVTSTDEVGALDALGADAQVGMALYSGRLDLGDAVAAALSSDRPDGLWPTVVCDELGTALGLCYSDAESLRAAVRERRGIYHSRSRGLWRKGQSSGDTQQLLRVEVDCDRDALCFVVRQRGGGFCHTGSWRCFGEAQGLGALERRLADRLRDAPVGSYTRRLADDAELLASKLGEEARELSVARDHADVVHETADVIYFALVAMKSRGVSLAEVARELDRRALRVQRRPGDAKKATGGAKKAPGDS